MDATTPKLDVRDVTMAFKAKRDSVRVLENINLRVDAGEFVSIIGASGCGKSTLLSIIAGLTTQTEGAVFLDGDQVYGPGPDRGLVFQGYSLYPWRSVSDNIGFGLELMGIPKREQKERIEYYIRVIGLEKWADSPPAKLSGGMRQRVAIARALATQPEVLLLDEPFGALDAQTRILMQEFLLDIWRRTHTTILLVTHDVEEAIYLSQRIYVFSSHPGRLKREITVPFGPIRDHEVQRSPEFLDLRDEIHDLLMPEAVEV